MSITLNIQAEDSDVTEIHDCRERLAAAFLDSKETELTEFLNDAKYEFIREYFPEWEAMHQESLRDEMADHKLHSIRNGD